MPAEKDGNGRPEWVHARPVQVGRGLVALALVAAFACMVGWSWRWPLLADAAAMRYVNFLIDHGMAPYRQILDINLPGTYFSDRVGVFLFGPSDLGWRLYDVLLMVAATVGMVAVAWPYDWLAGLFAGVLFALAHAADGPTLMGERDQVIAVLLVLGYAALFQSVRRRQPGWMAGLGLALGMAATVKPMTAPLGPVLLLMAGSVLRRARVRVGAYVGWGLVGAALAAAVFFGFLLRHGAVGSFFAITREITAYYAGLGRVGWVPLLREMVPRTLRLVFLLGAIAAVLNWRVRSRARSGLFAQDRGNEVGSGAGEGLGWERWALAVGLAAGVVSYFAQGKGFSHHRYELMALGLLWFSLEFALAIRTSMAGWAGTGRVAAWGGVAAGLALALPSSLVQVRAATYANFSAWVREAEDGLRGLGAGSGGNADVARLQGNVQCLDMTDGCYNALYRLGLVQRTGVMGDTLLFAPGSAAAEGGEGVDLVPGAGADAAAAVVKKYRGLFWEELLRDPPEVFVVSNEAFLDPPTFDKVNRWPPFADYLALHYTLYQERRIDAKFAFRIYVHRTGGLEMR